MTDRSLGIFIASASEGLDVANAVRDGLKGQSRFEPRVWNEGTFKPSMTYIESLEAELARSDFAVLTLTADDHSLSRGHRGMSPRDNVLFELGLFMGHLGRERTYFVYDKKQELKIPTDLLGVSPASYERREGQDLREALAPACSFIAQRMLELDFRPKITPEAKIEKRLMIGFCQRIAGIWWGRQCSSEGEIRLALFQIALDNGANTLRLNGDTFDRNGALYGRWRSVAIGIRVSDRALLWAWEGTHPILSPGEVFKGFGHYTFDDAVGIYERGDGLFSDIHMGRKKAARWTSVELRRVDIADLERTIKVMKYGSDNARTSEVVKALDTFTRAADLEI